jgi:hypothetical protein
MHSTHQQIITLIIAYTCALVFIATAIAAVLDMYNRLRLEPEIRMRLYTVLIVEIVVIAVVSFRGFLDPSAIVEQVKNNNTPNQELLEYVTKTTKESIYGDYSVPALAAAARGGIPYPISLDDSSCKARMHSIYIAGGETYTVRYNPSSGTYLISGKDPTGKIQAITTPAHQPPGDNGVTLDLVDTTLRVDYNQLTVSTKAGVVGRITLNWGGRLGRSEYPAVTK